MDFSADQGECAYLPICAKVPTAQFIDLLRIKVVGIAEPKDRPPNK